MAQIRANAAIFRREQLPPVPAAGGGAARHRSTAHPIVPLLRQRWSKPEEFGAIWAVSGGAGKSVTFRGDVRDLPEAEPSPPVEYPRFTEDPKDPDPSSKLFERPESLIDPLLERPEPPIDSPLKQQKALQQERTFNPPDLNIPGIPFQGGAPPDTVGEVGSNHYIQMTNASVVPLLS